MQHAPWHFEPSAGGHVAIDTLQMRPVDPIAYRMNDIWGYDSDELPIEPFDIEIRIIAPTVLEGLEIFAKAVQEYMQENLAAIPANNFSSASNGGTITQKSESAKFWMEG